MSTEPRDPPASDPEAARARAAHDGEVSEKAHHGPLDRLLSAVPVDALIRQIDVQALVQRIDLNALLDEIDVNRLLSRIDVHELVSRADIPSILAESTKGIAARALDALRGFVARCDGLIERVVDRTLGRVRDDQIIPPWETVKTTTPGVSLRGRTAGPVSRLLAGLLDLAIASVALSALIAAVVVVADFVGGSRVTLQVPASVGIPATTAWVALYFVVSWAIPGRTPGMAVFGLLLTRGDGMKVSWGHALLRVLILPFSAVVVVGFFGIVFGRNHRALQDVIADTRVVFDW